MIFIPAVSLVEWLFTTWLVTGQILFLLIPVLGIVCFSYIVAKRLVPLLRGRT